MGIQYDTVAYLGFTFIHKTKEPNCSDNVGVIRQSIINKVASMSDDEILLDIEYNETIEEEI